MNTHPFQAKDHGNGILELIAIFPGMGPDHPTIQSLGVFARKFKCVIFTLEKGSYLEITALPKLIDASVFTKLKVVTTTADQFPFYKAGIPTFPTTADAIKSVKGDEIQEQVLKKLDAIPQLNTQAFEILQKLNKPETSFTDLDKIISQQPGLASQMLKTANSAFFMRRSKADTLASALSYLGIEGVKQILVFNVFKGLNGYWGAQEEVLTHGRHCAHLATFIATAGKVDAVNVSKIRLAGLLHDIGSLALAFYFPKEYKDVKALVKAGQKRTYEAEFEIFGIEHQALGKKLAEAWGFPEYLATVVGDHHSLRHSGFDKLTVPVLCANGFLNQTIEKIPFSPYYHKLREYFSNLGERVSIQDIQKILEEELKSCKPETA